MKHLLVLAVVLVLLVLMVSSVSAEEGIASPHIFLKRAASGAENVVIKPPTIPAVASDDTVTPMAGGSTITIIIAGKRAVTIENTDPVGGSNGGSKPPRPTGVTSKRTVIVQGSSTVERPPGTQPT